MFYKKKVSLKNKSNWEEVIKNERGQAVTELAITLPLIIFLIMAMLKVGLFIHTNTVVVLAATQGARLGAVLYGDCSVPTSVADQRIRQVSLGVLSNTLTGTGNTVNITDDGINISVEVTHQFPVFIPLVREVFGNQAEIPVSFTATYRIE